MGGFQPLPWDESGARSLEATALYWEWMVRKGKQYGKAIPNDYMEIHCDELVSDPRHTLRTLGEFLDHDLDYNHIQSAGKGRLRESNSSFRDETGSTPVKAANRWKQDCRGSKWQAWSRLSADVSRNRATI